MVNPENNELAAYIISHWKIWEPWIKYHKFGSFELFWERCLWNPKNHLENNQGLFSFLITTQQHIHRVWINPKTSLKPGHGHSWICWLDWGNIGGGFQEVFKLFYFFAIGWWQIMKVQMQQWNKINMGSHSSMNFECLIPLSTQSFAFPMHIQQMFFCKWYKWS
jgi:hypothetical protein